MDLEPLSQQNKSISMCGKNWGREIQLSPLPTRRFQPPLLTLEDLASVTLKRACGSPYRNIIYCAEWRGKEIPTDTVRMTKPHIEFERSGKTDKKIQATVPLMIFLFPGEKWSFFPGGRRQFRIGLASQLCVWVQMVLLASCLPLWASVSHLSYLV